MCREVEICKDSLLHLHRIKTKFTSVRSRSDSPATAASSLGHSSRPGLVFPGPELRCQAGRGVLGYLSTQGAGGGRRRLGVCVFGKAFRLFTLGVLTARGRPCQAVQMLPGGPDASHEQATRPGLWWYLLWAVPTRLPGQVSQAHPLSTSPLPPPSSATSSSELARPRAGAGLQTCFVSFCFALFNLSWQ